MSYAHSMSYDHAMSYDHTMSYAHAMSYDHAMSYAYRRTISYDIVYDHLMNKQNCLTNFYMYIKISQTFSEKITCSSIILAMPPKAEYWKYFNLWEW